MNQQGQVRWNKVIFVDWHGVLSLDPFWMSIIHNEEHPLHSSLSEAVRKLFGEHDDLVRDWMRGNITTSQIVDSLQIELELEVVRKPFNNGEQAGQLYKACVKVIVVLPSCPHSPIIM